LWKEAGSWMKNILTFDSNRAMVYGKLSEDQLREANRRGLDIGSVSLQHLFIYLTEEGNADGLLKNLS